MTYTDKHIVETYLELLEGLSVDCKMLLIESLSKSIKEEKEKNKEKKFYKSFGSLKTQSLA